MLPSGAWLRQAQCHPQSGHQADKSRGGPGRCDAKLVFEQTEVSPDLWLPKRLVLSGSGRIGLVKRLSQQEEIEWSNYRKFSVDSKIVPNN